MTDIVPSSPQGQALQASIQKQLAVLGWSTEDDAVMAEYCLVMLGNRKTADQISTELSDLIGGDFDASFVTWLFGEVKKHYPDPSASPSVAAAAPPPSASSAPPSGPANGGPSRPNGPPGGNRNVFGAAMGGVKRNAQDIEGQQQDGGRQQQRQRFEAPAGPRALGGGTKSLFDRVNGQNPQFAPGRNAGPVNTTGMPQPAFDAITQTVQAVLSGAHASILANIPFPALVAHPFSQNLPPLVMQQAQANAVAQAQALAAMQSVWNTPAAALNGGGNGFGAPAAPAGGFNPNAPAFNPAFAGGRPQQQQQQTKPAPPPVKLPSKPEQESICKHGVDCNKATCPFSHPSPVATKESGLVLSSEACDKQLKCADPDCPKSHVSKAQLSPSAVAAAASSASRAPPPPAAAAPPAAFGAPPTGTPCKFGAQCTRPGCYFVHPWDVSGVPSGGTAAAGPTQCRYGAGCTRADCHFTHPPSRSKPSNKYVKPSSASSSFGGKKQEAHIGSWPSESKEHVSERLKRFAGGEGGKEGGEGGEGGVERIVPGGSGGGAEKKEEKEDKVEIHFDDEDDKKHEKKEEGEKEKEKEAATAAA